MRRADSIDDYIASAGSWQEELLRLREDRAALAQGDEILEMGGDLPRLAIPAVFIGLVYGYLPFMVLPLYASIERLDWSLVEAARDLYASGFQAFRRVTLPLLRPAS